MNPSDIIREVRLALLADGMTARADRLSTAEMMTRRLERFADEVAAEAQDEELARASAVECGAVIDLRSATPLRRMA